MSQMNFCTATLLGCSVLQSTSCPPAPPFKKTPTTVNFYLKQQLFGMNVIDEAGVVLIHHGQLVPGRAHVQAAHGRGLLQQHDRQGVIHEDLQDLDRFETKSLQTFLSLEWETAQQVKTLVLFKV